MSTPIGKERYRYWLTHSQEWETLRLLCLAASEMKCRGCGLVSEKHHLHHVAYPKRWSETTVWHLRVLCKECHKRIHELTDPSVHEFLHQGACEFRKALKAIHLEKGLGKKRRNKLRKHNGGHDLKALARTVEDAFTSKLLSNPTNGERLCFASRLTALPPNNL